MTVHNTGRYMSVAASDGVLAYRCAIARRQTGVQQTQAEHTATLKYATPAIPNSAGIRLTTTKPGYKVPLDGRSMACGLLWGACETHPVRIFLDKARQWIKKWGIAKE